MSAEVKIRKAAISDAENIRLLLIDLGYSLDIEDVRKNIEALEENSKNKIILAIDNDMAVGLITIAWQTILHYPAPIARITGFVVSAKQRSKGIGQKLLAAAEECARKEGCSHIELTTASHRKEAHGFYARAGYEQNSLKFRKSLSGQKP